MSYKDNYLKWLNDENLNERDKKNLIEMGKNEELVKESFTAPLAFGTAGMRGILALGMNRMNVYTVMRAALGLSKFIVSKGADAMKRGVLIGYDTRNMSFEFAAISAKVFEYNKINSYIYENVRPVPMVSFGVREMKTFAGVMVTASHNPKEYNGYKVYGQDGAQLSLVDSDELSAVINGIDDYIGIPCSDTVVTRETINGKDDYKLSEYITVVGRSLDERFYARVSSLALSPEEVKKVGSSIKLVYTPLHGVGFIPVTTMLDRMGIKVTCVKEQTVPDGNFSTVKIPNPEQSEALTMGLELADKTGADAVIGTDPDCDRMGVAIRDGNGNMVLLTGNQTGVLLTDYVLKRRAETGKLPENAAFVKSIVTTSLAKCVAESYGVTAVDVLTGFKFFGEKIKEWETNGAHQYMFGFEESYGYLAGTHARDKDGVSAATTFAEMVCYYKAHGLSIMDRLGEIYNKFGCYVDKSVSTMYPGLSGMNTMANIMEKLKNTDVKSLGGIDVEYKSDFSENTKTFANGKTERLPQAKSNVIMFGLGDGDWVCARPSGTEPKLKSYISVHADTMDKANAKADAVMADFIKLLKE